jgi:hypothetical protein
MFLTRDEMTILLDLHKFASEPNNVGEHYRIVGVPSHIYRKLIIGLGPTMANSILKPKHPPVAPDTSVRAWLDRVQAEFATPEEMMEAARKLLDPNTRRMVERRAGKWKAESRKSLITHPGLNGEPSVLPDGPKKRK